MEGGVSDPTFHVFRVHQTELSDEYVKHKT